jgi:hypothetical protein
MFLVLKRFNWKLIKEFYQFYVLIVCLNINL